MNYYHPTTLEHIRNPLPAVAEWAMGTDLAVPDYDPQTQRCAFIDGAWVVETCTAPLPDLADYQTLVQGKLDDKARERKYDGILSLCTYATSTNTTFAAEGQAGVAWRDGAWAACYALLAQWQAEEIPQPTLAEVEATLPVMEWPG